MKKYLHSIAVLALALGSATMAWADNVVYGLIPSYTYGARTTSVDLDKVNSTAATTLTPGFGYENAQEVMCGVTAGDKYFAFVKTTDPDTYEENVELATFNFTTENIVQVNNFSYTYGKPGYNASGMAYDKVNDVLYATEIGFDENDAYVTNVYSVDQTTGELTKVTSLPARYEAITADNKGGFYLMQIKDEDNKYYPCLYKMSSSFEISPVVENTTFSTGYSANFSMVASEDGKTVYLIIGKKVVAFDTDAKTTTLKGTLSDNLAAASYGKSTADGTHNEKPASAKKNTRFLVEAWTYGSSMGDISDDVVSKREYYHYNQEGKLINQASTARQYSDTGISNVFAPYYWTKVGFDENANMTSKDIYQWGPYDYDDFAWKLTKNNESYTYDENGRLTTKTDSRYNYEYTYDEDGHLATMKKYIKSSNKLEQTITYSNYDENGNALMYVSEGTWDNYSAQLTYDNDGNKLDEYQYTEVVDPNNPEMPVTTPKQYEKWTYNDNVLASYEKFAFDNEQNEVPTYKTEYTPVDGNTNVIDVKNYSYNNGTWYPEGKPERDFYTDFDGMAEMTAMEFMAENDPKQPATVDLMFSIPQMAYTQNSLMVIYRDGLPIDSLTTEDLFTIADPETGAITYQDKGVKNGTHTYFLQPKFAANSEFGPLDAEGGESSEETEWTGYYSTMPMDVEVNTELPAVTDLKLASGRMVTEGNLATGKTTTYYATLSWKNPENAADYGFVKNSIYFESAGVAEKDTADIAADKAEVMLYGDDEKAYVLTTYQLGKVKSESIDVKIKDIENLATGIETVAEDGTKISFNGRNISLGNNANVTVFSLNGQKVLENTNVNNVSLDMPAATYIITVEKNGKVSAYKYNVK